MNASEAEAPQNPVPVAAKPSMSLGLFGLILTLVSIGAFFFSLAVAYYFAIKDRPPSEAGAGYFSPWFLASTGLILASSVLLQWARRELRVASFEKYRTFLRLTLAAGLFFLITQLLGCQELAARGVYVVGNPRGSMYYMFSGVHALHLAGGIGALIWLWKRAQHLEDGEEQPLRKHRAAARLTSIYWHFMGVVWVGLFACLLAWGR